MATEQSEIIKNYTARTARLDSILDVLTRDFCASKCSNGIPGCCWHDTYRLEIPDEMLELQEEEALKNGWRISNNEDHSCRYHSSEGCKLALLKPPMCINSLCKDLRNYLEEKHGVVGRLFTSLMGEANSFCLNKSPEEREKLFLYMDQAIYFGGILTESDKQKQEEAE